MSLFDMFTEMVSQKPLDNVQFEVPADKVLGIPSYNTKPAKAGNAYFQLWATEMQVTQDSEFLKLLATWYPVLHSVVRFDYGNTKGLEVARLTDLAGLKDKVGVNFEAGKVVALNFPLTEVVPFNEGRVEIAVGLLAMKEKDKLQAALRLASDMSSLLAVPQLSSVLSIAKPLTDNLSNILGMGESQFRLGYYNNFTEAKEGGIQANVLKSQYISIIAREPGTQISRNGAECWVDKDHLFYVDPADPKYRKDVPGDYIMLRLDVHSTRDWQTLPELSGPYKLALEAGFKGDKETAASQLNTAILRAWDLPDLARDDWQRVAEEISNTYKRQVKVRVTADQLESLAALPKNPGRFIRSSSKAPASLESATTRRGLESMHPNQPVSISPSVIPDSLKRQLVTSDNVPVAE